MGCKYKVDGASNWPVAQLGLDCTVLLAGGQGDPPVPPSRSHGAPAGPGRGQYTQGCTLVYC
jgi:hypothetical protein